MFRTLKSRLAERSPILNGYCTIPSAFSAELYARQGWDSITIDLQHGLIDYNSAIPMIQALSAVDVSILTRVPALEPGLIQKMLDAGVQGITCPMINTAEEAKTLVRYCKYPPKGERSAGPLRAALVYGSDYISSANEFVNVFAMVETIEAVENIQSILSVDGLDGIYLGPQDLSMSMGKGPQREQIDPEVDAFVMHVLHECKRQGLIAGAMAPNPQQARKMANDGFQFITLASDARALVGQTKSWIESFRSQS